MSRSSNLRARDDPSGGEPKSPPAGQSSTQFHAEPGAETASHLASLDVAGRIVALKEAFRTRAEPDVEPAPAGKAWGELARGLWARHRRVLKTLSGLLV